MTLSTSSSNIKDFPDSNNENPIWKKPIRIGQVVVVPIPESLVKKLHIDEECTSFEVTPTETGILLRIASKKVGSSHIVEGSVV